MKLKLQFLVGGLWTYVFCRNSRYSTPITTSNPNKALGADAKTYFEKCFGNHVFRAVKQ